MRKHRWRWLLATALAALLLGWAAMEHDPQMSCPGSRARWLAEVRDEQGSLILCRPVSRPGREILALRRAGTRLLLIPLPEYNEIL